MCGVHGWSGPKAGARTGLTAVNCGDLSRVRAWWRNVAGGMPRRAAAQRAPGWIARNQRSILPVSARPRTLENDESLRRK